MLLRQLLERSDRSGVPVYLESSNARNLSFYARHGFLALGTVPLPGGTAGMTPMLPEVPR
jgi:hypothetical protein